MKQVLMSNSNMTTLALAFWDNLFPLPYIGQLKTGFSITTINGEDCIYFYFDDDYYIKLNNHIKNEYDQGKFAKSNSEQRWIKLMNSLKNFSECNEITEKVTDYLPSQPWPDEIRKKITITKAIESTGPFSFKEDIWEKLQKINGGFFSETKENYTIETENGEKITFAKNSELLYAKLINRYLQADLNLHELLETDDTNYGSLLFYRPKDEPIKNKMIIATVAGIIGGSAIFFEV